MKQARRTRIPVRVVFVVVLSLITLRLVIFPPVYGDRLNDRQLRLGSATPAVATAYRVSFGLISAGTLGSIVIQFCSNDPVPGTPCTPPVGFNDSGSSLGSQTGETGFSISNGSTSNEIILTRTPAANSAGPVSYTFDNVLNPSATGSYYVRLQTFASDDASGANVDYGGLAFAIDNSIAINAEVPPYIIFCTGVSIPSFNCASAQGSYVDVGELSPNYTSSGTSQMLVATNAKDGYTISQTGSTLTSGNNVIKPLSTSDVSRPGTAQYGLNLRANSTPAVGAAPQGDGTGQPTASYNQKDFFRFRPGEVVASGSQAENYRRYTVSYIVNVPAGQPAGVYASTMTYVALGSF